MILFKPFRYLLYLLIISFFSSGVLIAQNTNDPEARQEYRGAWIASVINLDWPISKNATTENQKLQMLAIFDSLQESGFNAVYLQIRTEGDALYDSEYAPWSYYLTGEEGVPPEPYYDPLEFALDEAHKRGLELHAWLNPYRAVRQLSTAKQVDSDQTVDPAMLSVIEGKYDNDIQGKNDPVFDRDPSHVFYAHPEWTITINNYVFLDPGQPEVIQHVKNIVGEIVNNYDVDGIHFDDYFYPYPPNNMLAQSSYNEKDDNTFSEHPRGFTDKNDWRRNNINLLMQEVQDTVKSVKPFVKFGVSPFGIWQSSTPPGTSGLSARTTLFADALAWIEDESVDYLVPQLYWEFGCCQNFDLLSDWWKDQAGDKVQFYAGIGLYKSDRSTYSGSLYSSREVPNQIRYTREINAEGNVMFRSRNLTVYNSRGIRDTLRTDLYKNRALVPAFEKINLPVPDMPLSAQLSQNPIEEQSSEVVLSWGRPGYSAENDSLIRYAIYRTEGETAPAAADLVSDPDNFIAITGLEEFVDTPGNTETSYHYAITAFNRNSDESTPTAVLSSGVVTSSEGDYEPVVQRLRLDQNYPNPFNPSTNITFQLPQNSDVSLIVYDMVGREVAVLVNRQMTAGIHNATFEASRYPSGVYFYRLETASGSLSRKMTLIK
jgi:uncharacterized lipoprotein YddW (UPF0748 family)